MRRLVVAAVMLASSVFAGPHDSWQRVAVEGASTATRLDALLRSYFPADGPGAAVLVSVDGKPLFRGAYGLADLELNVPLRADHVLHIGSLTKQFTAVAILQLVQDGKLSLTDPVSKFVPGLPDWTAGVTIEHLLTHTSGIKSYTELPEYSATMCEDITPRDLLARAVKAPQQFPAGSAFAYSNSGYVLLGMIIEAASGMPYADYLALHLFKPLGMTHTRFGDTAAMIPGRVPGYSRAAGAWMRAPLLSMTQPWAAGGLVSTVDDLQKWSDALIAGNVIRRELRDRAWSAYRLSNGKPAPYGYGWFITNLWGHAAVEHAGAVNGYSSYLAVLPEKSVVVAVMTNSDAPPADPGFIAAQAASFALGVPYDPQPVALSRERLQAYEGRYKTEGQETTRLLCVERNQLYSARVGGRRSAMQPMSDDRFFYPGSFLQVQFERDAAGAVTAMKIIGPEGVREVAPRVEANCPK